MGTILIRKYFMPISSLIVFVLVGDISCCCCWFKLIVEDEVEVDTIWLEVSGTVDVLACCACAKPARLLFDCDICAVWLCEGAFGLDELGVDANDEGDARLDGDVEDCIGF
jgi:hypothetical protein